MNIVSVWTEKPQYNQTMQIHNMISTLLAAAVLLALLSCGAKGDPRPHQRHPPAQCGVRALSIRMFEVVLPTKDTQGDRLSGLEAVRVYYLPLGANYPSALDIFQQGEAILERRRPNLPSPGKTIVMDLSHFGRSAGWLTVVPFRIGDIPGVPSQVLPWVDPAF